MKRLPAIQFYEDTLGLLPASREGMWAAEGAPPPANPGAAATPGLLERREWKTGWERLWDSRCLLDQLPAWPPWPGTLGQVHEAPKEGGNTPNEPWPSF